MVKTECQNAKTDRFWVSKTKRGCFSTGVFPALLGTAQGLGPPPPGHHSRGRAPAGKGRWLHHGAKFGSQPDSVMHESQIAVADLARDTFCMHAVDCCLQRVHICLKPLFGIICSFGMLLRTMLRT